jgi:hypothetical protein
MDAVTGIGDIESSLEAGSHPVDRTDKNDSSSTQTKAEDTANEGGPLNLSMNYVSLALQSCGFVDISAGPTGNSDEITELGPGSGQNEADASLTQELAARIAEDIRMSSIEQILEIVRPLDPKYAIKLLTQSPGG